MPIELEYVATFISANSETINNIVTKSTQIQKQHLEQCKTCDDLYFDCGEFDESLSIY